MQTGYQSQVFVTSPHELELRKLTLSVEPKNLNEEESDWQEFLLEANSSAQVKSFAHVFVSTCSEPAGPPADAKRHPKWSLKRVELYFFYFLEQHKNLASATCQQKNRLRDRFYGSNLDRFS